MNPTVVVNQAPAATPTINVTMPAPLSGRIEAHISVINIIGHTLLWMVLITVTFGIALFFYPYSLAKLIIQSCSVIDSQGRKSRLQCNLGAGGQIGHILLWIVLSIITFGVAIPFYFFKVFNLALNKTQIVP